MFKNFMNTCGKIWWVFKIAGLLVAGAAAVLFFQHGGDRITAHETSDARDMLERINRYCYTRDADERTCRLYLTAFGNYSWQNPNVLGMKPKLLPKAEREAQQSQSGLRAQMEPQRRSNPVGEAVANGVARVMDSAAQAAAVAGQPGL